VFFMSKDFTIAYVSIKKEDDITIDNLRVEKCKHEKRHYTKNDIIKHLITLGLDVEAGRFISADPDIDKFVSQLQNYVIEINGEKVVMKKTKDQVYKMLIEKGLQSLQRS
jgi:hypothetical protein